jgi:hypothetical protein
LGNHPSQICHALIEGREVLTQGLIRRIGDGTSTRIWTQNWLPPDQSMRPIAWREADPTMLVHELVNSTSVSWDIEKLNKFFVQVDIDTIKSIPLCTDCWRLLGLEF